VVLVIHPFCQNFLPRNLEDPRTLRRRPLEHIYSRMLFRTSFVPLLGQLSIELLFSNKDPTPRK